VSTYTTYLAHYLEDAGSGALDVPSIGPGSVLGTPSVDASGDVSISPPSIGPNITLGSPTVTSTGDAFLAPPSIGPNTQLGTPAVSEQPTGQVDMTILPIANALLACLCTEIALVPDPPAQCCLRTGLTVVPGVSLNEDECCTGLAWVRYVTSYPSEQNFPEQDPAPGGGCPPDWFAVVLEMGVVRCMPTGDLYVNPTCTEWTLAATNVMNDDAAMRRAYCCLPVANDMKMLGVWEPLPTEGRCTGGIRTVTVQVPNCDGCEEL